MKTAGEFLFLENAGADEEAADGEEEDYAFRTKTLPRVLNVMAGDGKGQFVDPQDQQDGEWHASRPDWEDSRNGSWAEKAWALMQV